MVVRLWHKDLLEVLPQKQLVSQWRECCAIARNIAIEGSPNHILVNRIMDYPLEHFIRYSKKVQMAMIFRNYYCDYYNLSKWFTNREEIERFWPAQITPIELVRLKDDDIFYDWHNDRYYWQCYYNLEEKYDCGGISQDEWETICDEVCLRL